MKRLFYDIETSYNEITAWGTGKQYVSYHQIKKERAVVCISYKWEDGDVKTLHWNRKQDDKKMLERFAKIISKADEMVAHNGDNFDVKWLKGRMLHHGISNPGHMITVDTYKQAKKHFRLNSYALNYLGHYLGVGEKIRTPSDLWDRVCYDNDKEALQEMIEYCEGDVLLLQRVYEKLQNWMDVKQHAGVLAGGKKYSCPQCGGINVICHLTRTTAMGTIRRLMKCKSCRRLYTISNKSYMDLVMDRLNGKA